MKLVLLGAPGSGKGTQAKELHAHFGLPNISLGDIIRKNIKDNTELGKIAKEIVINGNLLSDDLIMKITKQRLSEEDCAKGFILDGCPRTIGQAEILENIEHIEHAILLEVSEEIIMSRLSARLVCACGAFFNSKYNPPKVPNVCDSCGEILHTREDDDIDTILNRIKVYNFEIKPVREFYERKKVLRVINDHGSVEENFKEILKSCGQ